MAIYRTYQTTLQNGSQPEALEMARNWSLFDFEEVTEQSIAYARHVENVEGVAVYYDYGADYYFFGPA